MFKGEDKLYKPITEFEFWYKYRGHYFKEKELLKFIKPFWTSVKDNRTKYNILRNPDRWIELELIGIEVFIAAPFGNQHVILNDGTVINVERNMLVGNNADAWVYFQEDGERHQRLRTHLIWKFFCDPSFDAFDNSQKFTFSNYRRLDKFSLDNIYPNNAASPKTKGYKKESDYSR